MGHRFAPMKKEKLATDGARIYTDEKRDRTERFFFKSVSICVHLWLIVCLHRCKSVPHRWLKVNLRGEENAISRCVFIGGHADRGGAGGPEGCHDRLLADWR